jgi:hypothetical protein
MPLTNAVPRTRRRIAASQPSPTTQPPFIPCCRIPRSRQWNQSVRSVGQTGQAAVRAGPTREAVPNQCSTGNQSITAFRLIEYSHPSSSRDPVKHIWAIHIKTKRVRNRRDPIPCGDICGRLHEPAARTIEFGCLAGSTGLGIRTRRARAICARRPIATVPRVRCRRAPRRPSRRCWVASWVWDLSADREWSPRPKTSGARPGNRIDTWIARQNLPG